MFVRSFENCNKKIHHTALDQTIRIWNYETGKVELVQKYLVDVSVVALHPSGLLVCVGFLDNMQLKEVMLDTLKVGTRMLGTKCNKFSKILVLPRVSKRSIFQDVETQCFHTKVIY